MDKLKIRNFIARNQLQSRKAKKLPHKNNRRAKDARKSWRNEDY